MPPNKKAAAPPAKKQKKSVVDDQDLAIQEDDSAITLAAVPPPPIPSEPTSAIQQSYTYASRVPSECSKIDPSSPSIKVPCVLGVDEAGRGPVLGPLVYGIAYCPISYQDDLKQIGFADSKALTAQHRDTLLSALIDHKQHLGWSVRVMSPQDISAGMLRRRPVNLNAQSSQATVSLIAGVLEQGVDVTEIYVDTVGDPNTYKKLLSSHFPRHPHIKWTVTSKADAIYPIVGAASIAAKVTRDRCIEGWRYAEQQQGVEEKMGEKNGEGVAKVLGDTTNCVASQAAEGGSKKRKVETEAETTSSRNGIEAVWDNMVPLGSGYPGDPNTVAFLKRTLDPVFGWPGIVRFSWATAKTMLEEKYKPPSSSASTSTTSTASGSEPAPSLGGKRLTRSLSRTSSFTTDASAAAEVDTPSQTTAATLRPTSLYGTFLPQPSVVGGTAQRGYKVKWIDEPVAISKFFGPGANKAAAPGKSSTSQADPQSGEVKQDAFQISALQASIDHWLKAEPQWRAKKSAAANGDASDAAGQIQINVDKLTKDLGLTSAGASFCL